MEKILHMVSRKTHSSGLASLPLILKYLLELKTTDLLMSSIKVHLAAISTFQQKHYQYSLTLLQSAFWHTCKTCTHKPNDCTKSPHPPFEPLATGSLHLLMKVAFLIAITSARRVGEIETLMAHPP